MLKALIKPFLPMLLALGLLVLTACGTTQTNAPIQVDISPELRADCDRAPRPDAEGLQVGELAAFSTAQEGDIAKCEAKKRAAVELLDSTNAAIIEAYGKKRPWWRVW